jgi:hypothetical protein
MTSPPTPLFLAVGAAYDSYAHLLFPIFVVCITAWLTNTTLDGTLAAARRAADALIARATPAATAARAAAARTAVAAARERAAAAIAAAERDKRAVR